MSSCCSVFLQLWHWCHRASPTGIMSIRLRFPARINRCGTTHCLVMAVHRFSKNIPVSVKLQLTIFQADSVFSGISTFGRLPYFPCLASDDEKFDIAFLGSRSCPTLLLHKTDFDLIGAPFDTGTSYRPGARFGPSGIRQGSRRLNL